MKTTITEKDGLLVVALSGGFDTVASNQAERDLAPVFERDDCDVQIDCSDTLYISSSGLRLLLNIYKHVSQNGHKVSITGQSQFSVERTAGRVARHAHAGTTA